jgi:hypothetical protein
MPRVVIDLPAGEQEAEGPVLEAVLPGRVNLSLAELVHLAEAAGTQLPIHVEPPEDIDPSPMEARLGGGAPSPMSAAADLLRGELAAGPDLASLAERGLGDETGNPTPDVAVALHALGTPEALIQIDVALRGDGATTSLRAWYAVVGAQVAQLATADGLAYELSWYPVRHLATGLARAAILDSGEPPSGDRDQGTVTLPYEFFIVGLEAARVSRGDILDHLVAGLKPSSVTGADGAAMAAHRVKPLIDAFQTRTRGTLRALITSASSGEQSGRRPVGGLVSWILLDDGWRWLEPIGNREDPKVTIHPVTPADLGKVIAPVLTQVVR